MFPGWDDLPPPCLMTGFSQSLREGGWGKLVVNQ